MIQAHNCGIGCKRTIWARAVIVTGFPSYYYNIFEYAFAIRTVKTCVITTRTSSKPNTSLKQNNEFNGITHCNVHAVVQVFFLFRLYVMYDKRKNCYKQEARFNRFETREITLITIINKSKCTFNWRLKQQL